MPAVVMPYHESPSPGAHPPLADRASSTHSISKASSSEALDSHSHKAANHKPHKAHAPGHARLPHSRNPSYGKNLNKLTKITGLHDEGSSTKAHTKHKNHTPSTSPSTQHIKRNSSNVSLHRGASKVSIKKNSSNVSLKRNGSSTQVGKNSRPTTPLRRSQDYGKELVHAKGPVQFSTGSDDEDKDEDWTEDSNSQSPSTTRRSSLSRGLHSSRAATPPPDTRHITGSRSNLPDSPPESPVIVDASEARNEINEDDANHFMTHHPSRHPDADDITSRLISRHSMQNLPPQITSISATSTPGQQTPPIYHQRETQLQTVPSMPENGISRFLGPSSGNSSGSATTALNNFTTPLSPYARQMRSPSPNTEAVRRAKSAGNLASDFHPTVTPNIEPGRRSPPSYTFSPAPNRRPGGNTQAKLDLWRTQVNVEPSHGPPAPLMKGAPEAMLGSDERRARLWEKAESEWGYLKRFRNPVVDGARRVIKARKSGRPRDGLEEGRGRREGELFNVGSRPPSRAGGRSVRFEVADGDDVEGGDDDGGEESDRFEEMLRRMWEGGGGTVGGNPADG